MSTTILEASQLRKTYTVDSREIEVLKSVSLTVGKGEFLVIKGSSGSGKTTLLSLLSGLDIPDEGEIVLEGTSLNTLSENELAPIRNKRIGFVFQSFHLVPSLTAFENVTFPAEINKDKDAASKAESLLKQMGMWQRRKNIPSQLSGGEKQRVAICRALINNPSVLFADEPTGNLDLENSLQIMNIFAQLHEERQMTFILATHSQRLAEIADRVITLHDGRIEPPIE